MLEPSSKIISLAILVMLSPACRPRLSKSSAIKSANTVNPMAAYEVVDCTPALCGSDVSIVDVNPQDRDLAALGIGSGQSTLALDDSTKAPNVAGSDAEQALDASAAGSKAMTKNFSGLGHSEVTNTSMKTLFQGFHSLVQTSEKMSDFTKTNIIAKDDVARKKTMAKIVSLNQKVKSSVGGTDVPNTDTLKSSMAALLSIAGDDGWINRGDLPRLLPVIPNIVGKIADQRISKGYADGIAELAQSHPLAYNRWVRMPNGLIGSIVQRNINGQLNDAYAQKWTAIQQASNGFQKTFNQLMDAFEVKSYYLKANDGKLYYDPGNTLEVDQINALSVAIAGKTIDELAKDSAGSDPQADHLFDGIDKNPVVDLSNEIELPDGIPVAEIDRLLQESNGFKDIAFPKDLSFELLDNGKLRISKLRGSTPNSSGQTQTPVTAEKISPAQSSKLVCAGLTTPSTTPGTVMMYLYSSFPGTALELQTEGLFFKMTGDEPPQNGIPLIRSGPANMRWGKIPSVTMRVTMMDGSTALCTGNLGHQ